MGARAGNTNAKREATRVSACLSISDEKGKLRRSWAVRQLQHQGVEHPTPEQISRFVKDWCYNKIDEAMEEEQNHEETPVSV